MAAYTELPDGRLIRWRFDPDEDRAKHYERGVAAGKGER